MFDTMEDRFWLFVIEMYFLGFGLFAGMVIGHGLAERNPDSK